MTLNLLLAWWNLIYVLPFGLAVAYLGIYVFTGMTFGDHDVDVDGDMGGDGGGEFGSGEVHVEAHVAGGDMDADGDADVDGEVDGDTAGGPQVTGGSGTALAHAVHAEAGHAGHTGGATVFSFLSLLGVGRIPLSLLLMVLMLIWGAAGFLLNQILTPWMPGWMVGAVSLPVTGMISLGATSLVARVIGRYLPAMETYAHRRHELVGQVGEAIYGIDATFGLVSVRDRQGDLFQVPCRTADDGPVIAKGARVVLFDYDSEEGVFRVAAFDPQR